MVVVKRPPYCKQIFFVLSFMSLDGLFALFGCVSCKNNRRSWGWPSISDTWFEMQILHYLYLSRPFFVCRYAILLWTEWKGNFDYLNFIHSCISFFSETVSNILTSKVATEVVDTLVIISISSLQPTIAHSTIRRYGRLHLIQVNLNKSESVLLHQNKLLNCRSVTFLASLVPYVKVFHTEVLLWKCSIVGASSTKCAEYRIVVPFDYSTVL